MMHLNLTAMVCLWGALVFSPPAFACVEVISRETLINHNTNFDCELLFIDQGRLIVQEGVTVKISGPVTAERKEIFTGPGLVELTGSHFPLAFPEWFGADAGGVTDSSLSFQKAVDALVNGGTLLGDPDAVYRLQEDVTIRNNHTIFNMGNALIKGTSIKKIRCDGDFDGHEPGDWSTALKGCIVKNIRLGDANDSQNRFGGVALRWCMGCGVENIVKKGETGSFSMSVCRDSFFKNIENYGSHPTRPKIGFLLHMTWNALVDNCHAKDGPFVYGFQVKGGENATIINASATDLVVTSDHEDAVIPKIAFRDRGDAPWKASATADGSLTYPFADKSWNEPDIRRASHNTRFVNLSVINAPNATAYKVQEAMGARFHNVTAHHVRMGLTFIRAVNGEASDFRVDNFLIEESLAGAISIKSNDGAPLTNVHLKSGEILSDNPGITLNNTESICFASISINGNDLQSSDLTEENTSGTGITRCEWDLDCDRDVDGSDLGTYARGYYESLEGFAHAFGKAGCSE